jgi:Holliday junction resolvase RusA-like endonuclease
MTNPNPRASSGNSSNKALLAFPKGEGARGVCLNLPKPPSTNNLFINTKRGRVISPDYRTWRDVAGWELLRQKPTKLKGPVSVKFEHEDEGRGDGDNKLKAVFDLLVAHQVIEDDTRKIVRAFSFEWSKDVEGVRVTVCPV